MRRPELPSPEIAEPWLRAGWAVPLARRLTPRDEPIAVFERIRHRPYPFLLESARVHPVTGRYSFLGSDPSTVILAKGRQVWSGPPGRLHPSDDHPLNMVRALLAARRTVVIDGLPPFIGGAVGAFGYDLARWFERLPEQATDDLGLPDLTLGIYETIVAFDHLEQVAWIITRIDPNDGDAAYDRAVQRLDAWTDRATSLPSSALAPSAMDGLVEPPAALVAELDQSAFEALVHQAKRWIADGAIYQANLSQRLSTALTASPWSLYQRLRAVNPSPFAAYLDWGDTQLVSASPERLVRVAGDLVETRPIAGTRPRTGRPDEDSRWRRELLAHPKERAEHLMLVDLERNDLGRVCAYGSIEVSELMALESYSHVVHLVSNVRGRRRPDCDWLDVLAAVFPGGTITGCPKVRAIEIIDALEPVRRQFYTGSIGYVSFTGAMDLNIVIRSAIVTGGRVYGQVGAGIVADSDPSREYDETLQKAQALLVALRGSPDPSAQRADAVLLG